MDLARSFPLATDAAIVPSVDTERACLHCRAPVPASATDSFCCRGCEAVHHLLTEAGLERYYELGGGEGHPVTPVTGDHKWLEPIVVRLASAQGLTRVVLDAQGIHCAACVWLFEQVFWKESGACGIVVNPAVGSVELTVTPAFSLEDYVHGVEAFGYRLGPPLKRDDAKRGSPDLLWRMGVCIAIAMNTMIFAVAIYCGLADGPVHRLFHALDFGLSFVSVLVGGTVFFRSAWRALRRRTLHLDVPIALGILLAFASSTYTYATRGGATSYFDTLNVFIALMLVGRFLQERVLAKNRAYLLASDGAEGLLTRRVRGEAVELVRCTEIEEGDLLLVGHQDLVPVDATLVSERPALLSLDWINGESAPRAFAPGEVVPAGAFCHDPQAVTLRACDPFDASRVVSLLRTSTRRDEDIARATPWWRTLTRIYVIAVLALAGAALVGWLAATGDLRRTLDVAAALLIVTCPCAFGIATPLAYELAQASLRRVGLFVRTPGFLDRAAHVSRVVFDKTGTLTTGALVVTSSEVMAALPEEARKRLYDMVVRSSHPKSRAIAIAIESLGSSNKFEPGTDVREIAGKGLESVEGGAVWRLGAAGWAIAGVEGRAHDPADVVFTRDGEIVAAIHVAEELREDARREVEALEREGYETFVLSGDSLEATQAMAAACGVPPARAFGAHSPEGKAAWLRERGPGAALFVGDGLNDSLVAEEALCAGTPAIDRPFMAARSDFYFVTPGLRPVRAALDMAKRLARVARVNLAIAIAYNVVAVTLALAGLMSPLLCAVLMPVSSLSTVLATTAQLRRTRWTS